MTVQVAETAKVFPLQLSVTISKFAALAPPSAAALRDAEARFPELVRVTVTLDPGEEPMLIFIEEIEVGEKVNMGANPVAAPERVTRFEEMVPSEI